MLYTIMLVLRHSAVSKIPDVEIDLDSIKVTNLHPNWTRTKKGKGYQLVNLEVSFYTLLR